MVFTLCLSESSFNCVSDCTVNLLSNIKLGTDLGILRELTDLKVQKLYLYIKPANLQKYLGEQYEP